MKNKHLPASLKQFVFASMWIAICLLVTCGAVQETSPVAAQTEPNVIWDIAWSPDGTQVAVGSTEGVVRLYTSDFRQSRLLELGVRFAFGLAWSPDGEKLALGTYVPDAPGSEVQVWDISSNTHITTIARDRPDSRSIAWSADSQRIAIADGYLNVWDATSGELLNTLESDTPAVFSVAWSPDGQYLASLGSDDLITVWETTSYSIIRTLAGAAVTDKVIWSPDSTKIASGDRGNVKIWDAATGQLLTTLAAEGIFIEALDWRADTLVNANTIVVGMHGFGRVYIWDVTNERLMRTVDDDVIFSVALSPDGTRVAYGGYRGSLEVIDTPLPGNEPPVADAGSDQTKPNVIWDIAWSPDGTQVAVGNLEGVVRLYTSDFRQSRLLELGVRFAFGLAWSPDGKKLALGTYVPDLLEVEVQVWDISSNTLITTIAREWAERMSIAWSPDSQRIAIANWQLTVWDATSGELLNTLESDTPVVFSVAWSPDGQYLASLGSDDLITVWETTSYSIIRTLAGAAVTDEVIWSPDSTKIASGDRGNVKIWDAATGQVLTTLAAEGIFIQALDWRADTLVNANSIVVGMHGFGRIYIWDVTNERLMRMVDDGVIFAAALSPDGTRVAYGGYRGSLEVIDTPLPGNEPPVADAGPDQTKPSTASAQDADQYYYAYVYQVPAGGPIVIKAVNPNAPTDSMLLYSTNLPDHAPLESALASPDGRWIAVIPRSRGEYLRLIEVATGQMLDVSYHGIPFDFSDGSLLGQFESIVWSPNSQLLAFTSFTSDGTVDVFVYNLADGTLTNLSQDAASQYTLAWSPDSAYLASGGVACDGDECDAQIDIFEWATRSHVVSQHPAWGTYPAIKTMPCQLRWSLESRYLNFVASCDGTIPALEKELFLLDRIQGRVSRLTNYTQTAYQPPEAPVEYPVRLAWYDSVWYDTHTILLGATYGQEVPGDYVIRSQIIEYDLLNDSQTILRSDMTAEEWTPSPVQNLFAFRTASGYSPRTRHGVEIANVAAGVLTTIGSGPAGCDLAWSPDGATLAYTGRGQPMRSCYYSYYSADTLYFMDSLTGQLAQYTPVEMEPVQAVGWVALTAFNVPPTANAGPDQTVTAADGEFAQVLLDGSGSFDSDGTIINYGWYENGELIASGVSPEVTLGLGEHIITLTVDDNNAALRSDTVTVLVTE